MYAIQQERAEGGGFGKDDSVQSVTAGFKVIVVLATLSFTDQRTASLRHTNYHLLKR